MIPLVQRDPKNYTPEVRNVGLILILILIPHSAVRECNFSGPIGRAGFLIRRGFLVVHFAGGKVEGDGRKYRF